MFSTFWYHESFLIFFFLFDRFGGTIQTDLTGLQNTQKTRGPFAFVSSFHLKRIDALLKVSKFGAYEERLKHFKILLPWMLASPTYLVLHSHCKNFIAHATL